jgi:hypothetical protein
VLGALQPPDRVAVAASGVGESKTAEPGQVGEWPSGALAAEAYVSRISCHGFRARAGRSR